MEYGVDIERAEARAEADEPEKPEFSSILVEQRKSLPDEPGVYLFRDGDGEIVYVGKAKSIRKRVASHFGRPSTERSADMIAVVEQIDFLVTGSESEALLIEHNFIKRYQPHFNVLMRDDKSYPYIATRIEFSPQLPPWRRQLAQKMAMGAAIKFNLAYSSPFWRESGYSGEIVSNEGPVSVTYDNTTLDGRQAAIVGFIVGRHAHEWSGRAEGERREAVLAHLERYFGPQTRSYESYIDKDWSEEEWIGGAPTGYMPPGALSLMQEGISTPTGRIHWAGTETATEFNGYLEGALQSGERAVAEVIAALDANAK